MDANRQHEVSDQRSEATVASPPPAPLQASYVKPQLRDYGRLQPRLQFTPPNPP